MSAFVNAGIYHLIILLLARPNNAGFEATLRVVCYASFPIILTFLFLIPILNILVILALSVYVLILIALGIREVHGTSTGQAVVVALAPIVVSILLSIVLGILAAIIIPVFLSARA